MATTTANDGTTKVYFGRENLEWIRGEARKRGFMIGAKPNVSKMLIHICDEWRKMDSATTLTAAASSDPKGTRDRMRAALVLASGNVSDAARRIDVSRGDFVRAVEALDMGPEIARKYPKGAA